MSPLNSHSFSSIASIVALIALWQLSSVWIDDFYVFPPPTEVATQWLKELNAGELLPHLTATLLRVILAFALAMSIGAAIGFALGRFQTIERWIGLWVSVLLNIPALVVIVLCYVWLGLSEVAAILAVTINKIPTVVVTIREGVKALDRSLDELTQVYRVPFGVKLRHVWLPQLVPYVASAARNGIALIWKIVLVVEFLGRSNGVGFQIHLYFQNFDVAKILVYAISFVAVMLAVEILILKPLEKRSHQWRQQ